MSSSIGGFGMTAMGVANDLSDLATRMLEDAGVAVAPGRDFGEHRSESHLRFAYTRSLTELTEGVERLSRLVQLR